jgi:hypothetical protein
MGAPRRRILMTSTCVALLAILASIYLAAFIKHSAQAQNRATGNVPMDFYGVLTDQNGTPEANVVVTAKVTAIYPYFHDLERNSFDRETSVVSDSAGRFEFHANGMMLRICGLSRTAASQSQGFDTADECVFRYTGPDRNIGSLDRNHRQAIRVRYTGSVRG